MHNSQIENNFHARQWHMLLIYNIYRLVSIFVLLGLFWLNIHRSSYIDIYFLALFAYFIFGLFFFCFWYRRSLQFEQQVLWSGTIDIIVMVFFIHALGYLHSGLGILLNASIAVLSILAPGRLAIFFAAIASCMFLGISTAQYVYGIEHDISSFFSAGVHGAGFFATALTAWYLARWVHVSENLAQDRAKELVNMQRLNEYIVERLQYGVIYVDRDKQVRLMNTAARQFLNLDNSNNGVSLQELSPLIYEKYLNFLSKSHNVEQVAQAVIDNPFLQIHFFSTSYADQTAVLIILEDMTTIAQKAQDLKLASLGRFSASIAHELRNPLSVIAHAAQLMGDAERLNTEDSRLKQMIVDNCNRMNRIIKNVLQISRRQQSKPEVIELEPFLTQFKHDFCIINQCEILIEFSHRKQKSIVFDKSQLEQILVILCENAVQHGQDAEGEVKITILIKTKARQLLLMVYDTGSGIREDLRNTIFDPFFSTVITGNGMGLFIAKDLCEINQAQLSLAEVEEGCCFVITLNQSSEISL